MQVQVPLQEADPSLAGELLRSLYDAQAPGATGAEEALMSRFVLAHAQCYSFGTPVPSAFEELFRQLVGERLNNQAWRDAASAAHQLAVAQTIRVLLRDGALRSQWPQGGSAGVCVQLSEAATNHLSMTLDGGDIALLVELTTIAKRLCAAAPDGRRKRSDPPRPAAEFYAAGLQRPCVELLHSHDGAVVQGALTLLIHLALEWRRRPAECEVVPLDSVPRLLQLAQDCPNELRALAVQLLLLLTESSTVRIELRLADGPLVMLSLLQNTAADAEVSLALMHVLERLLVLGRPVTPPPGAGQGAGQEQLEDDGEPRLIGRDLQRLGGLPLLVRRLRHFGQRVGDPLAVEAAAVVCRVVAGLATVDITLADQLHRQAGALHALWADAVLGSCPAVLRDQQGLDAPAPTAAVVAGRATLQRAGWAALRALYGCRRLRHLFERQLLLLPAGIRALFAQGGGGGGGGSGGGERWAAVVKGCNAALESEVVRTAMVAAVADLDPTRWESGARPEKM